MENNFQLTTQIYGAYAWLYNRPVVVVIEILIVLTVLFAVRGILQPKGDNSSEAGEGAARNALISVPLAVVLFAAFAVAYRLTLDFQEAATAQFPNVIVLTALPLPFWILVQDGRAARVAIGSAGGLRGAWHAASGKAEMVPRVDFRLRPNSLCIG